MTRKKAPHALHVLFITSWFNQDVDDFLRAIVDLSKEADIHEHDSIIAGYEHTIPLNYDFLEGPILLRYIASSYPYELQMDKIEPSECILYELRKYADMGLPDNHSPTTIFETEQLNLPMVYFVYGKKDINLDTLRSELQLATPENLMVYDSSDPDSLKEILKKLVDIADFDFVVARKHLTQPSRFHKLKNQIKKRLSQ